MAKAHRAAASSSGNSKSTRRKAARRRTKPALRKAGKNRAVSDALLLVEDEFNNLRAAHRAYDCVENLLIPNHRHDFEEFLFQPNELWALFEVVNAEMGRRIQTVTDAIQSAREALH